MSKVSLILLTALMFCSCKEVAFREPQPKGRRALSYIPEKLQGKYLTFQENGELSQDTVIIFKNGYRFGYFDPLPERELKQDYDQGILSDSLVLKTYRGYYFLNLYEKPEWVLRVIKQDRNGDLVYMAMEQEDVDFKDYVSKLSTEIAIDSMQVENETLYYIDPSPPKLVDLIEKGYFTRTPLKKVK